MAAVKKATKKKTTTKSLVETPIGERPEESVRTSPNPFTVKRIGIGLLIGIIVVLAVYKKGIFVVATVNGRPITTVELLSKLNQNYRNKELDNMVTERVILDEAKKKNALPANQEIQDRVADIEKRFGGKESFDNLLSQQGQTRSMVEDQLRLQLAFEKLYSSETVVTEEEIDDFVKQNKTQLQATDPEGQRKEASDTLRQRKLSQISLQKLEELKKNANIQMF